MARHAARVRYFPAYEMTLDDFRDYRFYEADMIHHGTEAIKYIWETFIGCYATTTAKQFLKRRQLVLQGLRHRSQRSDVPSNQKYLQKMLQDLELFSGLDCSQEKSGNRFRLLA
jgi:hypothetical protein